MSVCTIEGLHPCIEAAGRYVWHKTATATMRTVLGFDEAAPSGAESVYVVSYGCGTRGVLLPDGTWDVREDHQDGCACPRDTESA